MKIIKEPVLEKNDSHPLDHQELTFKDFLIIQEAAQEVANKIGYDVYLVGSALKKHNPRDIDISIIVPYEEYYDKYIEGAYQITNPHYEAAAFLANAWYKEFENIEALLGLLHFGKYKIDLKITPCNWWIDKDKIILARPIK